MLDPIVAHAVCGGLCFADYLARAWRIQLLTRGVSYPLGFRDAMAVNLIGDAACSLTPLRIAGEPARLGVMLSAGVPPTASFVAITYEVLAAWPVIILAAAALLGLFAPQWWASAAPGMRLAFEEAWPWVVLVGVLTLGIWVWFRRRAPSTGHHQPGVARCRPAGARRNPARQSATRIDAGGILRAAVQPADSPDAIRCRCCRAGFPGGCRGQPGEWGACVVARVAVLHHRHRLGAGNCDGSPSVWLEVASWLVSASTSMNYPTAKAPRLLYI
jgi:hypothetical protein